jgi:hypothetical protein
VQGHCKTNKNVPESEVENDQAITVPDIDNATLPIVDPRLEAIKLKESQLAKTVVELESTLRSERILLAKSKDKLSETGKTGFFMVQAQVADFMVRHSSIFCLK